MIWIPAGGAPSTTITCVYLAQLAHTFPTLAPQPRVRLRHDPKPALLGTTSKKAPALLQMITAAPPAHSAHMRLTKPCQRSARPNSLPNARPERTFTPCTAPSLPATATFRATLCLVRGDLRSSVFFPTGRKRPKMFRSGAQNLTD